MVSPRSARSRPAQRKKKNGAFVIKTQKRRANTRIQEGGGDSAEATVTFRLTPLNPLNPLTPPDPGETAVKELRIPQRPWHTSSVHAKQKATLPAGTIRPRTRISHSRTISDGPGKLLTSERGGGANPSANTLCPFTFLCCVSGSNHAGQRSALAIIPSCLRRRAGRERKDTPPGAPHRWRPDRCCEDVSVFQQLLRYEIELVTRRPR